MRVITDFHLHSKWSRACSKELTVRNIAKACEKKGIQYVGTSDFTHPEWRRELGEMLEEDENGAWKLKNDDSPTRFLFSTEVSCIYKQGEKTRRVHHIILFPHLNAVDRFTQALVNRGVNIKSDGRPIFGVNSSDILRMVLEADEKGLLIPAHAWTPWFSVFGSQSGFDSLQECFGDLASKISAIETGLSSDPKMNWMLSKLDSLFLVSNSDAHSLDKLGREANVFEMDHPNYDELYRILTEHDYKKFLETIEFFPEEGKYHADGHRACGVWLEPAETKRLKGICPKCGKPLVIGVLHRVSDLADRESGQKPEKTVPFRSIMPLAELIGSVLEVGSSSQKVRRILERVLIEGRSEFGILLDLEVPELSRLFESEIVEGISRMRRGEVFVRPGYDGEYGIISVRSDQSNLKPKQAKLL